MNEKAIEAATKSLNNDLVALVSFPVWEKTPEGWREEMRACMRRAIAAYEAAVDAAHELMQVTTAKEAFEASVRDLRRAVEAAPSDATFDQQMQDYRNSLAGYLAAIAAYEKALRGPIEEAREGHS